MVIVYNLLFQAYMCRAGATSSVDDFVARPRFTKKEYLLKLYPCCLCHDILVQPQQTVCGGRACKACIYRKFGSRDVIPCPMPHDDIDDDELPEEPCQKTGLQKHQVLPDAAIERDLLREKCFCPHQVCGCSDTPTWKKLKDHLTNCLFTPVFCPNTGCPEQLSKEALDRHLEQCMFTVVPCNYCGERYKRNQLEDHYGEGENADTQCEICNLELGKRRQLTVHQKIRVHVPCITAAGKCYFYDHCKFEADTVSKLKQHMVKDKDSHFEWLAIKLHSIEQTTTKIIDLKLVAEVTMTIETLSNRQTISGTNGDHLLNVMRTVAHSSQQIEQVSEEVEAIERQIRDSGLGKITVIEARTENITKNTQTLSSMEKSMESMEFVSYNGELIWKISNYKQKKSDAVGGRQMSIYSYPFYTSRYGYKMCAKAYLNGDGNGKGKCLSLFFVLMRGEFDELLTFPFKQRVTFTLLSPRNQRLNKHVIFLPGSDSAPFKKPLTDMNIASGCPTFALQCDVESSDFLISDCIYVRVKVESGDARIPEIGVRKPCLRTEFKGNQVINCPLTHSELDDMELGQELCQQKGLCKTDVFADKACQ
ncbi:TNF receptor-associated factor 3-like [Watersipora subatra]|uniref:TNF receptor-associated factor 3-like n=1 Tax=Watersipora subatra TaxID=2589382 RepID=UPI00355BF099